MMSKLTFLAGLSVLFPTVMAREGLHLGTYGLLQVPPSFSGSKISLFPAHHPDHDASDLGHLTPSDSNELYYSQEGHRPALHGAKHGSMKAKFTGPTVVLDHTDQLRSIQCQNNSKIDLCFTPEGFGQAQSTWTMRVFNLITYHVGCADESSGQRSYFRAEDPQFDAQSGCIIVKATSVQQEDTVDSGEITWGTYTHPEQRKRVPVKGHIRVNKYRDPFLTQKKVRRDDLPSQTDVEDKTDDDTLDTDPIEPIDMGSPVDLTQDPNALVNFFGASDFDLSSIHDPVGPEFDLDFIETDGTVETEDEANGSITQRDPINFYRPRIPSVDPKPRPLQERGIIEFFKGLYNGIKSFFNSAADFFTSAVKLISNIGKVVLELAIIAAKLIAVPFGVPFDHAYHNDFKFTHVIQAEKTNRPPNIFGYTDGYNLAGSGGIYSIQCAKCGTHGDFSVDGRLAFNIRDGITDGKISLTNNDPFTIDAVFGITLEVQYDKSIKSFEKQIAAVPLSPLTIPGIITLGPQLSISGALDFVLNGKAELLVGGSLSIAAGTAALSLVNKADNKLDGLETTFTPVAKFTGTLTATVELGLPIALEVGLDVLNGKFKKTVGLVNKPSVYASAIITNSDDSKCTKGIELRVGVKNRIYVQALDLWDYDIRTDILYEKGIACVTADGFDTSAVGPDISVFIPVTKTLGADIANVKPEIHDVAATLEQKNDNIGFRIIMDEDKTSILVSGEDGYIYLVGTNEKYDLSSPWGSIDLKSNGVNLDVFGRIMSYRPDTHAGLSVEPRLWDPAKIPDKERAGALTNLKTAHRDFKAYGLFLSRNGNYFMYYTTFCPMPGGLRLYGTYFLVDKDGYIRGRNVDAANMKKGIQQFGVKGGCRTIRLTSEITVH